MRSPCYVKYFYLLVEKPKLTALRTTSAQHISPDRSYTFERPVQPSENVKCSFQALAPKQRPAALA